MVKREWRTRRTWDGSSADGKLEIMFKGNQRGKTYLVGARANHALRSRGGIVKVETLEEEREGRTLIV
jgi:hypothetical protein